MKEDAAAKELEDLLRDALNTGLEEPRGSSPLIQLKTVPLQVQHLPMKAAPAPAPVEESPESIPGLADQLAPESIRPGALGDSPKAKRRTSLVAIVAMGTFALAAAGGAVWLARGRRVVPVASASTTTVAPSVSATDEGAAVGISLAARPADAPPAGEKHDEAKAPTATPPVLSATISTGSAEPKPEVRDGDAKNDLKDSKPEAKAKPAAPAPRADARPSEKTADKVEKVDKPDSVDALLQQQLNGAIP